MPTVSLDLNRLYRILRDDENPIFGLTAKDPNATKTVQSHVGCGGRNNYKSQYISCTANLQAAELWARVRYVRIVQIDLDYLKTLTYVKIYDLTGGDPNLLPGVLAQNFAKFYAEVLLEGYVPPAAIASTWMLNQVQICTIL